MTTQDDMRTGLALAIARDGGNQPDVKNINDVLWKEDYLRFADAALAFLRTRLLSDEAVERAVDAMVYVAVSIDDENDIWDVINVRAGMGSSPVEHTFPKREAAEIAAAKINARAAIAAAVGEG